jgi:hypothetical protein
MQFFIKNDEKVSFGVLTRAINASLTIRKVAGDTQKGL